MKPKTPVKPEAEYTVTYLYYSQEAGLKALGIRPNKGRPSNIHCDGCNKVRVELFHPVKE